MRTNWIGFQSRPPPADANSALACSLDVRASDFELYVVMWKQHERYQADVFYSSEQLNNMLTTRSKGNRSGAAALTVKHACTIMKCRSETDTIFCKNYEKLERFDIFSIKYQLEGTDTECWTGLPISAPGYWGTEVADLTLDFLSSVKTRQLLPHCNRKDIIRLACFSKPICVQFPLRRSQWFSLANI